MIIVMFSTLNSNMKTVFCISILNGQLHIRADVDHFHVCSECWSLFNHFFTPCFTENFIVNLIVIRNNVCGEGGMKAFCVYKSANLLAQNKANNKFYFDTVLGQRVLSAVFDNPNNAP